MICESDAIYVYFIFLFTWLLNNHHRYSCVKLYTNRSVLYSTGFFLNIAIFINKCTTRYNIQIKYSIYISQYMSRSSIIAMTNHMIIMVCESDSCMFVFTCIMQNRYYYIDTITIRYPTTSDVFYHNVLLSMPYHIEMLLPKRSSLTFFFIHF